MTEHDEPEVITGPEAQLFIGDEGELLKPPEADAVINFFETSVSRPFGPESPDGTRGGQSKLIAEHLTGAAQLASLQRIDKPQMVQVLNSVVALKWHTEEEQAKEIQVASNFLKQKVYGRTDVEPIATRDVFKGTSQEFAWQGAPIKLEVGNQTIPRTIVASQINGEWVYRMNRGNEVTPLEPEGRDFGRSDFIEYQFPEDPEISRKHMMIKGDGDKLTVADYSTNGTEFEVYSYPEIPENSE